MQHRSYVAHQAEMHLWRRIPERHRAASPASEEDPEKPSEGLFFFYTTIRQIIATCAGGFL